MASGSITSWQIDGETTETVREFIFLGSRITADGDCSLEIKRRLLLGRKAMTNIDSLLESRDITLPTKACLVKAMVFLVVMYGCESWTIKKAKKIKSVTVSIVSPSICHEVTGPDAMIFISWILSFKPAFSLSSLTFIKWLFSSSSLSAIRVVSSAYLRLSLFLLAILIPAWASSSPAFHMMYSAYKLNKHGDNIQPWRTPFPIWNQSVVPCPVLTVSSWPAYRFLNRSGGLVFPSLSELSAVCYDPHSQRPWHSQ